MITDEMRQSRSWCRCSVQRALLVLVLVLVLPVEISGCFAVQLNKWGLITWDSWWSWSCRSFTASASTYFIPTDRYHSGVGSVDGRTNSNPNLGIDPFDGLRRDGTPSTASQSRTNGVGDLRRPKCPVSSLTCVTRCP